MAKKQNQKTAMNSITPYPTVGEVLHFFIDSLDMWAKIGDTQKAQKNFQKQLERLIQEKDIHLEDADETIRKPFKKAVENSFPKFVQTSFNVFVDRSLDSYRGIVSENASFLTRKDTMKWLMDAFFPIIVFHFKEAVSTSINLSEKPIDFPEKNFWMLPEQTEKGVVWPIDTVISWWHGNIDDKEKSLSRFIQEISKKIYETNEKHQGQIVKKWMKNKHLPKYSHIKKISGYENDHTRKAVIQSCLLLSRAIHYICNHSIKSYGKNVTFKWIERLKEYYYNKANLDKEYEDFIQACNSLKLNEDENFKNFLEIAQYSLLEKYTDLNNKKVKGDKGKADEYIAEIEKMRPFNKRLSYYIHWNKARGHILMNEPKKALSFYEKAFEAAKYNGGISLKSIIREGMIVAARFNKKSLIKKMYKWASYFDKHLFTDSYDNIKDGFIDSLSKKYHVTFPERFFYPEAKKSKTCSESSLIYTPEWTIRKLDLRHPDRMIKGFGPRAQTQLMIYSALGEPDKVKKLLEKGADPNITDTSNATALISAVGSGEKQRDCARLLLAHPEIHLSINRKTNRQKQTALGQAIDAGDVEMVEWLLEKGADVNLRISTSELTPLNYAIQKIPFIDFLKKQKENPHILPKNFDAAEAAIAFDASTDFIPNNAVFDDDYRALYEQVDSRTSQNPIEIKVKEALFDIEEKKQKNYREIIDVLLSAKPDLEAKNMNGFTCLMVASEVGETDIVRKLIKNGADVNATAEDNVTALIKSCEKGHQAIVEILIEAGADIYAKAFHPYMRREVDSFDMAMGLQHNNIVKMLLKADMKSSAKKGGLIAPSIWMQKAIGRGIEIQNIL